MPARKRERSYRAYSAQFMRAGENAVQMECSRSAVRPCGPAGTGVAGSHRQGASLSRFPGPWRDSQ